MPVDDRTRLNVHRTLENTIGAEGADALMAHLPPVTWNEVATKNDLDQLATRSEMLAGFADLRGDIQGLRTEFVEATNRQIKWLVTFAAAWSALLLTAVRLMP